MNVNGQPVLLCVDCMTKVEQIRLRQGEEQERMINALANQMYEMSGLPSPGPIFPQRTSIKLQGTTMNNITISDSQIGVVNTGNVHTIDVTLSSLNAQGQGELSSALKALTETILTDRSLTERQRSEAVEILTTVTSEAATQEPERRKSVLRSLFGEVGNLIRTSSAAMTLYEKLAPMIAALA